MTRTGKAGSAQNQTDTSQNFASDGYNLQEQTQEEVIANVERMLANEKLSIKTLAKATTAQEFDLNEGIVTSAKKDKASKVKSGG